VAELPGQLGQPGTQNVQALIDSAPPMDQLQAGMLETAISYASRGDADGARIYLSGMSKDGLANAVGALMKLMPLARSELLKK
jgi:hypothetical protein